MPTALKVILIILGAGVLLLFVYACLSAAKNEDEYYCLWDDIEHCDEPLTPEDGYSHIVCNLSDYFEGGKNDD